MSRAEYTFRLKPEHRARRFEEIAGRLPLDLAPISIYHPDIRDATHINIQITSSRKNRKSLISIMRDLGYEFRELVLKPVDD